MQNAPSFGKERNFVLQREPHVGEKPGHSADLPGVELVGWFSGIPVGERVT